MEKIPAMKIVRTKSAEYFSKFLPGTTPQYHFDLETDNYDTKSKFVHSSFQSIVEVAEFGIKEIAIPTRLNLGENYNLINLVEIAELACLCIQPIFSTFASLIHHGELDQNLVFQELLKIDSEFTVFLE